MKFKAPPYVKAFVDRLGRSKYYYRRAGYPSARLPGVPYSPEFMAAYEVAEASGDRAKSNTVRNAGAGRTKVGTINFVAINYFASGNFQKNAASTQTTYRGIIDRFREEHGEKGVATLMRKHVEEFVADRWSDPSAAHNLLRMLRALMKHAIRLGFRADDPTAGVKSPLKKNDGFHSWTDEELEKCENKYPVGTRARLAFDLLFHTAQRRSDVVRMGRQHIRDGVLSITQKKTGMQVDIPVAEPLRRSIDAAQSKHLTFLVTEAGAPFSEAGFTNWFKDLRNAAGLKNCTPHGLRKARARVMAEAGCTAYEIMAITGHTTLVEAQRYTAKFDRKKLAQSAAKKLAEAAAQKTATGATVVKP